MNNLTRRAFTLIEILVVVAIIAIMLSFIFPAVSNMQEKARVTQDMNNLRQIGLATQMYLNDNDNALFPNGNWPPLLRTKYLGTWKIFQSPFDKRTGSESDTAAPVSYGFNLNAVGILSDRVTNPTICILFAPAQKSGADVGFSGTPQTSVTVDKANSAPDGPAAGGTHNSRKRINALHADLHVETMAWTRFINETSAAGDENAQQRWNPLATPTPAGP